MCRSHPVNSMARAIRQCFLDYLTVSRLLGHKRIQTTIDFYTSFETIAAGRRFRAQLMQTALAIVISLVAPMRLRNLVELASLICRPPWTGSPRASCSRRTS